MLLIHQRMAELYTISRTRPLTPAELTEQQQCLHANAAYCWEMARLNAEGLLAAQTGDTGWQQEIHAQLAEVRAGGKAGRRRN
ncbi:MULTISPECIES: hypothetical protein [unclassified Paenibacillus]|nr:MULTISPECIES: hypothetical protein [unclassified Paenibacillus]MDF9841824.1 hypothetical protein [Paenibacillus sp. PastF-2]MDF9848495.1 hypothetical protein [Paenibacillus sp. PastM-2]MDF9854984.1 hypothetical protein [Paenibacillus sp. PastF-1]MDH6480253.1 hypothetical protein [Paenibacillus sp. PastH-2]